MSDYFSLSPRMDPRKLNEIVTQAIEAQPALPIPAYNVVDLPSAASHTNAIVRIKDNPQGQASSNGAVWISDVDGSNLGAGNDG